MTILSVCIDKEKQLKFYRDWLERVKRTGIRDPMNSFKTLSLDHPLTQKKVKELETHVAFFEGKITLDEFDKRLDVIETGKTGNPNSNSKVILRSDSPVWQVVRKEGIGMEQLDIGAVHKEGVGPIIELHWKKHIIPEVKERVKTSLRQEGYTIVSYG